MSPKKLIACVALASAPAIAADRYAVDPAHTYPRLEFSHMGISTWKGQFNKTSGSVTLDRAARTGSAEIRVDTSSIDFGLAAMNEFAARADWLDPRSFPEMTFKGKIVFDDARPAAIDGSLTLRGVTRALRLKIVNFGCLEHPMLKREVCGADAEGELNRADYGMTLYSEGEAGKVRLRIQVEAIKES
jgi:polyisoprenoid-binding protein YceI